MRKGRKEAETGGKWYITKPATMYKEKHSQLPATCHKPCGTTISEKVGGGRRISY